MTTNSSPPSRAACGARRARALQHQAHLAQERVAELVAGPVVDVLEVVAVEDDEAQLAPILLGATELAVEQILQPTPVVEARERIGVRAAALAVERHRRVERHRGMGGEERCQLTLAAVELACEAAGADEQADLLAVRPQRNQHHRPKLAGRRARAPTPRSCRAARTRPTRRCARAAPAASRAASGSGACAVALHSVDSTSCPSSSSSSSWLVSIGSTRPSERTATSAIACGSRSELM